MSSSSNPEFSKSLPQEGICAFCKHKLWTSAIDPNKESPPGDMNERPAVFKCDAIKIDLTDWIDEDTWKPDDDFYFLRQYGVLTRITNCNKYEAQSVIFIDDVQYDTGTDTLTVDVTVKNTTGTDTLNLYISEHNLPIDSVASVSDGTHTFSVVIPLLTQEYTVYAQMVTDKGMSLRYCFTILPPP